MKQLYKKSITVVFILSLLSLSSVLGIFHIDAYAEELSLTAIMKKNYQVNRTLDRTNHVKMQMNGKNGKKRLRKLKNFSILKSDNINEKGLIRFLYPPDLKGTGFLVIEYPQGDDDMWLYLPTLRKSRRKLSSNKKDSFMGTEFSYGDIVAAKVEEYKYNLLGREVIDGSECYVIEARPADKDVLKDYGYSKRIDYISKNNFTRLKSVFFDKHEKKLKTLTAKTPYEADPVNHNWFMRDMEMTNHQNGRRTVLKLEKITINSGIRDERFTVRYLERGR
jgi:outer membrane lipoprotein-sorting protein